MLLAVASALTATAQERTIKMPEEQPEHLALNTAEVSKGFWCAAEIGGGGTLMEHKNNVGMAGASFSCGYRVSQFIKVGGGIGALYYPSNNHVRDTKYHLGMPLFVNARGNILSEDIRSKVPYWSINIGATLPDGFFLTPQVGMRFGEKRSAFLVSVGYTLRHLKTNIANPTNNYSGILAKVGYEF